MTCRLDEIIVFRQLTKGEVKQIADIMLREVFKRAEEKEIKIDVTERFKVGLSTKSDAVVLRPRPPAAARKCCCKLANLSLIHLWSCWQTGLCSGL